MPRGNVTVISSDTLNQLRCLHTGSRLEVADDAFLQRLNRAIEANEICDQLGRPVQERVSGGLTDVGLTVFYSVVDGIPQFMRDESIPLDQLKRGE